MTIKPLSLTVLGFALITGCAVTENTMLKANSTSSSPLSAETKKSSYSLGLLHIKAIRESQYSLDHQAYEQGLRDALDNRGLVNTYSEADAKASWQALTNLSYAEVKTANKAAGKAFLENNKNREGVVVLDSGLQYEVLKQSKDTHIPTLKDTVGIVYKISGIDGVVKLDNMKGDVQKMYEMPIQKIFSKGWQEALQLMPKGSKWRLFIPGELAFGERGLSEKGILPNETLVIDTELVSIISPPTE